MSRRQFFKKCINGIISIGGGALLAVACHSADKPKTDQETGGDTANDCNNANLGTDDIKARKALGFAEQSPEKNKHCGNCKLYLPPPAGITCSKCQLFKGTVGEGAYCTYWAPMV